MVNHRDYYYKYKTLKHYFKNNIENQKQIKGGYDASGIFKSPCEATYNKVHFSQKEAFEKLVDDFRHNNNVECLSIQKLHNDELYKVDNTIKGKPGLIYLDECTLFQNIDEFLMSLLKKNTNSGLKSINELDIKEFKENRFEFKKDLLIKFYLPFYKLIEKLFSMNYKIDPNQLPDIVITVPDNIDIRSDTATIFKFKNFAGKLKPFKELSILDYEKRLPNIMKNFDDITKEYLNKSKVISYLNENEDINYMVDIKEAKEQIKVNTKSVLSTKYKILSSLSLF